MAYKLQSNPINQGALSGRYALKDLSNSGKFTNTINAIPVRYRLVLTGDSSEKTLTLVEGSTITILDGHSDTNSHTTLYEYYYMDNKYSFQTLSNDVSITLRGLPNVGVGDNDPTKYVYVMYNKRQSLTGRPALELATGPIYNGYKVTVDYTSEGTIATVDTSQTGSRIHMNGWDEELNYWYGPMGDRVSVPLGYFDGNWNFIQFNALGFYDKLFWVDRDVEILIPDGRTDTYGMNVDNTTINKITFTCFDGVGTHKPVVSLEEGIVILNKDGSVTISEDFSTYSILPSTVEDGYVYLSSENYIYSVSKTADGIIKVKQDCVKLCDIAMKDGSFGAITGENVYQAANLKDIKDDIEELQNTVVHNSGSEDINGTKHFTGDILFEHSTHNYITIKDGEIEDSTIWYCYTDENGIIKYYSKEQPLEANTKLYKADGSEVTAADGNYLIDTALQVIKFTPVVGDPVVLSYNAGSNITTQGNLDVKGLLNIEHSDRDMAIINTAGINGTSYDGSGGGIGIKTDAYIVGIESTSAGLCKYTNARNCLNIVGANNAAEGGIILGRYRSNGNTIQRMNKIYGDRDGNITFQAGTLLPYMANTMDIGSNNTKFNNVYANVFNGLATSAQWADLAEVYATDEEYPAGTLLSWGGTKELTIAKDEVNAVVSEKPAFLMNKDGEGQPIALAGRVRVRVVDKVSKFDKIYLSSIPGVGSAKPRFTDDKPIARALESIEEDGEKLVLCAIHFSI